MPHVKTSASVFSILLICGIAIGVMLPEWVTGPTVTHSIRYNIVWTEQFRDLFRQGLWYPRWLPHSWDGLGSPTFYFYPPLWFWIAAAIDATTGRLLSTEALITATTTIGLLASGSAMWVWLRSKGAPRPALFSIIYMVAPYHLYDIYIRGALAEALGYAALPFAAFALDRLEHDRRSGVALFAVACAVLLLTHLPTAVIAATLLLAPYSLALAWNAQSRLILLARIALGGVLGVGIASIYWLPAMWLIPSISLDAFTGPYFTASNWFFWAPWRWHAYATLQFVVPLTAGTALLSIFLIVRGGKGKFWAWLALAAAAMAAGLIPFLWDLPGFIQIQFPYRYLIMVEFSLVTAVALSWNEDPSFRLGVVALLIAAACLLLPKLAFRIIGTNILGTAHIAELRLQYRDAPEYLPRGLPIPDNELFVPAPELVRIPGTRFARIEEAKTTGVAVAARIRSLAVVRRFYYPFLRVSDEHGRDVSTFAAGRERLLAWAVPPGLHRFTLTVGPARGEREGFWIALCSLLAVFTTMMRRQTR